MRSTGDSPFQKREKTIEASSERYDVAIVGGGIAGLTLALQLKKCHPASNILVVEKQQHPVPEAAHKVGESTVEIAAHYLRDILGLQEHLQKQQLPKFGLRFFFSTADNQDITRRVELGHATLPPQSVESYQLDRGRLENALGRELLRQKMSFLDGCKVQQISLHPESDVHRLHIQQDGCEREIQARWVVDASGRSSLLKRQLGLAKKVEHHANAVWFRIGFPIDINAWSTDPTWQARIRDGKRSLSTNHLMGPGYWVWLIPLASGSISVGIVTDARMHPFEQMNRFERALAWLHEHEPQCAEAVEQHCNEVQDFRVMKDYAYSCEQVYSHERWCLTGEAGVFLDPFYSPGSDLIAISNGLVCDLISRELDGEDIEERAAIHNRLLLILNDSWRGTYEYQYPLMGNAQVMVAKIIWDIAIYWAVPGLLYFHDKFLSFGDSPAIAMNLLRFSILSDHIQRFLREWHAIDQRAAYDTFVRYYDFDFMLKLQIGMTTRLSDAEFDTQFAINVRFVEQLAGQLVSTVIEELAHHSQDETVQSRVQLWKSDAFLIELIALYQQENKTNPINASWITLGPQRQEVAR
ncbi:MAG: tryptophan 7-halogenase [Ktedonobacteraceae bacterium]|nr:tryptophan 7-halogenase [Ktedonobacteraceae bacterium]